MDNAGRRQPVRLSSAADLLLDDYLHRLGQAARRLPSWQRHLFLDEAAAQIDADLGTGAEVDLEQMRALLNRLGHPDSLVRATALVTDWPSSQELAAVVTLLIGGVVVPVVGWLVGVVLLWASPRWRFGDKLLGTLIWPGGLAWLGVLLWIAITLVPSALDPARAVLLLAVLAPAACVPPVLVSVRLLHRACRPASSRWPAGMTAPVPGEPTIAG